MCNLCVATEVMERVGAFETCDIHGARFLVDNSKLQGAYKMGDFWISKGNADCDRRELTDVIKDIFETTLDECPCCTDVKYEDD